MIVINMPTCVFPVLMACCALSLPAAVPTATPHPHRTAKPYLRFRFVTATCFTRSAQVLCASKICRAQVALAGLMWPKDQHQNHAASGMILCQAMRSLWCCGLSRSSTTHEYALLLPHLGCPRFNCSATVALMQRRTARTSHVHLMQPSVREKSRKPLRSHQGIASVIVGESESQLGQAWGLVPD